MESSFPAVMEAKTEVPPTRDSPDVEEVVKLAHEELQRLLQQRTEISKRIGSIKQTITGLCNLFGADALSDHLRELVNRKDGVRRPGITQVCRTVLREACGPMTTKEVSELIQQRLRPGSPCSKNVVASVNTILNRLVEYGEARILPNHNGARGWMWLSDARDGWPHAVDSAEHGDSQHRLDGL